jgi:hypothetical protein
MCKVNDSLRNGGTCTSRLVAYLMELQKEHAERLVPAPEVGVVGKAITE